jgi:hypothetical protein
MNRTAAQALAGRDVVLLPDLGMTEKWKGKIPVIITVKNRLADATAHTPAKGYGWA